jgi:hypothetical protein
MTDGYRNYSSILNHFEYPLRMVIPLHLPPQPQPPFDIHPPPNFLQQPVNIPSAAFIPASPNGVGRISSL